MLLTTKASLQLIHEFSNYKLNCIVCDFCDPSPQIESLIAWKCHQQMKLHLHILENDVLPDVVLLLFLSL